MKELREENRLRFLAKLSHSTLDVFHDTTDIISRYTSVLRHSDWRKTVLINLLATLVSCCDIVSLFFYSVSIEQTCGASFPAGSPLGTPEPLVLLTPPRCLTANRTQHGVLLTWLPPANHSSPIDRYIMEFRLGERWEVLDDLIPSTETELIARDLVQVSGGQMIPREFTENVHEDDAMLFQPYFRNKPRLVKQ